MNSKAGRRDSAGRRRRTFASTSDRLGQIATLYHREARKCTRGKAYHAGEPPRGLPEAVWFESRHDGWFIVPRLEID
jgi:hypothetical protein